MLSVRPGLWHDVEQLIMGPQLFDELAVMQSEKLCRTMHDELLEWTEDYKAHCVKMSLATPTPKELAMRRELFGTSLECLVLVKRLLATVCGEERLKLEQDVQALAHLIFDLQKQPSPKHSWLFTSHEVGVAYTAVITRDEWESGDVSTTLYDKKLAARARYAEWNKMLRMSDG